MSNVIGEREETLNIPFYMLFIKGLNVNKEHKSFVVLSTERSENCNCKL